MCAVIDRSALWLASGAPKGQKLLAHGNAMDYIFSDDVRPVSAKALIDLRNVLELLPLQGARFHLDGKP